MNEDELLNELKIILKILDTKNKHYFGFINNQHGGESYDQKHFGQGISRRKVKDKFEYYYVKNNKAVSKHDLDRINKLGIPPAWTDVWVSADDKNAIQAIGTDSKGRKQYRYHEAHIAEAEKNKFLRLIEFIKNLPDFFKTIQKHQSMPIYNKYRVMSTMLILVKMLHMRVGKEHYAKTNKSYGISSLKKNHVKISGDKVQFRFKGKSNQRLSYSFRNATLKNHLNMLMKLDGDKIFQYIDDNDTVRKITDIDLNNYIQEFMGSEFTIKDFRTYAANFHFVESLIDETKKRSPKNNKIIKKNIMHALKTTAHYMRHTKAISKKSYVMNFAIDLYTSNPKYFVQKSGEDIDVILLDLLKMYKKEILRM